MMSGQQSSQKYPLTSGGSTPDLSTLSSLKDDPQITLRKRKQPFDHDCGYSHEIKEVRSELTRISTLLEKYVESNEHIMKSMQENITEVRTQMLQMKESNEKTTTLLRNDVIELKTELSKIKKSSPNMSTEHKDIQSHFTRLEAKVDSKIKLLEDNFSKIKMPSQTTSSLTENQLCLNEQLVQEIQDRRNREKNIIIVGLPEPIAANDEERRLKDETEVQKIISLMDENTPKPIKTFRIGKYTTHKSRSIKVCFDSLQTAKNILRNKNKTPETIKIFSDQTPAQQKFLKTLQEELAVRTNNGENDITIKYIHGTPKIVKLTKNYTQ